MPGITFHPRHDRLDRRDRDFVVAAVQLMVDAPQGRRAMTAVFGLGNDGFVRIVRQKAPTPFAPEASVPSSASSNLAAVLIFVGLDARGWRYARIAGRFARLVLPRFQVCDPFLQSLVFRHQNRYLRGLRLDYCPQLKDQIVLLFRRQLCQIRGLKLHPRLESRHRFCVKRRSSRYLDPIIMQNPIQCAKRRFSEFPSELACNQEYAGGLEQGLDDEAEPVVAQREAPVFEHPSIAALHRPAPLAES
jgi:hypothetical protein